MYRQAHGAGRDALARVETSPADELPAGVPAPSQAPSSANPMALLAPNSEALEPQPARPKRRRGKGRPFVKGAAADLGRKGGLATVAKVNHVRVLDALGLRAYPSELAHYLDDADQFAKHEVERLAQTVGGGVCGAGPASMVQSAALALAASRYLYGTGDPKDLVTAARLADSSKQQILTAHELCAREAQARPQENDIERLHRELGVGVK